MSRSVSMLDAIFAANASTTIPASPVPGTTYRNTAVTSTMIENGWPYAEIVDSATFNQIMYRLTALLNAVEQQGILEWSEYTNYSAGSFARGSTDNSIYQATASSGPDDPVGVKDPDGGANTDYWSAYNSGGGFVVDVVRDTTVNIEHNHLYIVGIDTTFKLPVNFETGTNFRFAIITYTGEWQIVANEASVMQRMYDPDGDVYSDESDYDNTPLFENTTGSGLSIFEGYEVDTTVKALFPDGSLVGGGAGSSYWNISNPPNKTVAVNEDLTSTQDGDMVVEYYDTLTINAGATLSVSNRCKGLFIVCNNATIDGVLSMSGKGAYVDPVSAGVPASGLNIVIPKTGGGSTGQTNLAGCGADAIALQARFPLLTSDGYNINTPRAGGSGGASRTGPNNGKYDGYDGGTLENAPGGGGGGGAFDLCTSGAGAAGTCFSGGSGGGGTSSRPTPSDAGTAYGGPGGDVPTASDSNYSGGGGGGNDGGTGRSGANGTAQDGGDGTGGLLILSVRNNLVINGSIESEGIHGGGSSNVYYASGGGGTGGGRIIILYGTSYTNNGSVLVSGGSGGVGAGQDSSHSADGGDGGDGQITVSQFNL